MHPGCRFGLLGTVGIHGASEQYQAGKADEEQKKVYETVREAQRRAMEGLRPGMRCRDVDRIARDYIREAGYGAYYPHRTSHGIGIDYHEEPFDTPSRTVTLQENMCFSIEPGIYLPGRFGVRIEDLVLITEDGCRVLNEFPKELTILPFPEE